MGLSTTFRVMFTDTGIITGIIKAPAAKTSDKDSLCLFHRNDIYL